MMRLSTNVLGVFAVKNGRIAEKTLFNGSPAETALKLQETESSACPEEIELVKKLAATGVKKLAVNQPSRYWGRGLDIEFIEDREKPVDTLQLSNELGLDPKETIKLIREVNIHITHEKLKKAEPDSVLIEAVAALDDLEEVYNKLVERLREWYSIHYPELNHLVENHETYVKLVSEIGLRENYTPENLKLEPGFQERLINEAENSTGSEFNANDLNAVQSIANTLTETQKTQKNIETYIETLMKETAPNINALTGPLLGARLIKKANGLKRMATLPSSTIQILGAEDAFFRFLKTGKKPPKHGLIFQHPEIRNAPRENRGKLARTLAAKITLASKLDAYKGQNMGEKLNQDFMKRVKTLKK
jgi:nucleolar protein 56